jgi:hypothetical protein
MGQVAMPAAGYSGTPLARKLGIKPGHLVLLERAPADLTLDGLPEDVRIHHRLGAAATYDVVVTFCPDRNRFEERLAALVPHLETAGALWVAWPKKASGVVSDLTENVVRDTGLSTGLVDVKVCAIDATWSGLKLVRRLRDR